MAKPIMILGTMSNVGKSIITGGLCRVFMQDGYKAAPFKSQNMALNSFITKEGLEMGRAQVMQAEAAGIEPCVCMNPILLKPTNDTGSQVIINGEVEGVMTASEYYKKKKAYMPVIMEAYQKLEDVYDIIVIEGAGSPAEINLKSEDIVNMGMAKMVQAPALLVGDIDRGGVFAQIVGTMQLLDAEERSYIKGTIINKFRGDKNILQPGLRMLEEKAGIAVHGVVPYASLDIDEEDSLCERFTKKEKRGLIEIAVIKLPHISNFTDFHVLEQAEEVGLRYVAAPAELGTPDMIILPGTKNTMEDLKWLRQSGLEGRILRMAEAGKVIFGICGGYQMLGEHIRDPYGAESSGQIRGIGLLPVVTEFVPEKRRARITGTFAGVEGVLKRLSGLALEGYEIHMGTTNIRRDGTYMTLLQESESLKADGAQKGNVYGSYLHGIFDGAEVTKQLVVSLLEAKGYDTDTVKSCDRKAYKEEQYDILADLIRNHVDMNAVYRILEEGMGH